MLLCMRTTIQLDDQLLTEAKEWAVSSGRTLKAVIEDALREALARRNAPQLSPHVHLETFRGQGVLPGVDLDDSASLLDLMERDHGPA